MINVRVNSPPRGPLTERSQIPKHPAIQDGVRAKSGNPAGTRMKRNKAPRNPRLVNPAKLEGLSEVKLKPSVYMQRQLMTTEQLLNSTVEVQVPKIIQLLDIGQKSFQKLCSLPLESCLFQPFPSEVTFQHCQPCQPYQVGLQLRNMDHVPRLVKVNCEDSSYFKIVRPPHAGDKVAPGMAVTYKIVFIGDESKDYYYGVEVFTERELFIVPVRVIGPRAILDFPDDVDMLMCPVKHTTTRTLLIRNLGNREARFNVESHLPFQVEPASATLDVGHCMQVNVAFHPLNTGEHTTYIIVHYDTGEDVYMKVFASASDANIRIDKSTIHMPKTYIGLRSERFFSISNRSDIIVNFQWKRYETEAEEDAEINQVVSSLHKALSRDNLDSENEEDKLFTERQRIKQLTPSKDDFAFLDNEYSITPINGEIWPGQSAECSIVFQPEVVVESNLAAWLDVSGVEKRLGVKIYGEGVGPWCELSYDELDVGYVFMNSSSSYEIILKNRGQIDAYYRILSDNSFCQFSPEENPVNAGGYQAIQLMVCSPVIGVFKEEFFFEINDSPDKLRLSVTGTIAGPTFNFDVSEINFGNVAFGFPQTKVFELTNTSYIPMNFELRVPTDGSDVVAVEAESDEAVWNYNIDPFTKPKEFTIIPDSGTLAPMDSCPVTITMLSNTAKKYVNDTLVVRIVDMAQDVALLPIKCRCYVPELYITNPIIEYGKCFMHSPTAGFLTITNPTEFPAKYNLIEQSHMESSMILYESSAPSGIIAANSSFDLPITIRAQLKDHLQVGAYLSTFGSPDRPMQVILRAFGLGPVVFVASNELDYGTIPVLTEAIKRVTLENESPIAATYTCFLMQSTNSVFSVYPAQGILHPKSTLQINVVCFINDDIKCKDQLKIVFVDGLTHVIPLYAKGIGTTIEITPKLVPSYDLGPQFSTLPIKNELLIKNSGRRAQCLIFKTKGYSLSKTSQVTMDPFDIKKSESGVSLSPTFAINPCRIELQPGESITAYLEGYCKELKCVKETITCDTIFEGKGPKKTIMNIDVLAEFVEPCVQLSHQFINFRIDCCLGEVPQLQTMSLAITNITPLPLHMTLDICHPFYFKVDKDLVNIVNVSADPANFASVCVAFDSDYVQDRHCRIAKGLLTIKYRGNPTIHTIDVTGEVNFPNIEFSAKSIDFGSILNNTESTAVLRMTNNSPLDVKFAWTFLDPVKISYFQKPQNLMDTDNMDTIDHGVSSGDNFVDIDTVDNCDVEPELQVEENLAEEIRVYGGNDGGLNLGIPIEEIDDNLSQKDNIDVNFEGDNNTGEIANDFFANDGNLLNTSEERESTAMPRDSDEIIDSDAQITNVLNVDEVFDILPMFGRLAPSEAMTSVVTFYGHPEIQAESTAICSVEGGPDYNITLCGTASSMGFEIDHFEHDFGKVRFDEQCSAEFLIFNKGKVPLPFNVLTQNFAESGITNILPSVGIIDVEANEAVIRITLIPGIPEYFRVTIKLQVAHFEPCELIMFGIGTFPNIKLNIPRQYDSENATLCELKNSISKRLEGDKVVKNSIKGALDNLLMPGIKESCVVEDPPYSLHDEVENLLVKQYAENPEHTSLSEVVFPDYIIDFGYVILGDVKSQLVTLQNEGYLPVSFSTDKSALESSGFTANISRVKGLPGFPSYGTHEFIVKFDPRCANLQEGYVEVSMLFNLTNGPTIRLIMKATVTSPCLSIAQPYSDFGSVLCGQCKIVTMQLCNNESVACEWEVIYPPGPRIKIDKHLPMHLKPKQKPFKLNMKTFELLPSKGVIFPGAKMNVQIKFMPTEEKVYDVKLPIRVDCSAQIVGIRLSGTGIEPKLIFSSTNLTFGPVLPFSDGQYLSISVKNPTAHPIEFYSLEFDKQYLEEEKILRMMTGYDSYNNIILPPRVPGESLPSELLEFFMLFKQKQAELSKVQEWKDRSASALADSSVHDDRTLSATSSSKSSKEIMARGSGRKISPAPPTVSYPQTEQQPTTIERIEASELEYVPAVLEEDAEKEIPAEVGYATPLSGDKLQSRDTNTKENGVRAPEVSIPGTGRESAIDKVTGIGQLEMTPVSASIAKYLGIDLSPEGKAAELRRGVAIIVNGGPLSGKTQMSVELGKRYSANVLTIDDIILEAITSNYETPSGSQALEICAAAATQYKGEQDAEALADVINDTADMHLPATKPLKVAAEVHYEQPSKQHKMVTEIQNVEKHKDTSRIQTPVEVPQLPPLPFGKIIEFDDPKVAKDGLRTTHLPEHVIVQILAERFQAANCFNGIIIDGLKSWFCPTISTSAMYILKAFNNRKYLYIVSLKRDFESLQAYENNKKHEAELANIEYERLTRQAIHDLSEDCYDNLTDDQKSIIDNKQLAINKERLRLEHEKLEREKKQRELEALVKAQKLEEERLAKKRGKKVALSSKPRGTGEEAIAEQRKGKHDDDYENIKRKKGNKTFTTDVVEEVEEPQLTESEIHLHQLYKEFNTGFKEIMKVSDRWNRVELSVNRPLTPVEYRQPDDTNKFSKKKGKVKGKAVEHDIDKGKDSKELKDSLPIDNPTETPTDGERPDDGDGLVNIGIPHIVVNMNNSCADIISKFFETNLLPDSDEVLEGLGLGPDGPPVPPPATFSMVPFPVKRTMSDIAESSKFTFVAAHSNDLNIYPGAKQPPTPEPEFEENRSVTATPPKSKGKRQEKRAHSVTKDKKPRRSSSIVTSASKKEPDIDEPPVEIHQRDIHDGKPKPLQYYRWIVNADSEISLKLHFSSIERGTFDQTYNFELVGTRRKYQLHSRGICSFPNISTEPRVLYPARKRTQKEGDIVKKKFIGDTNTFEFGPLIIGKSRDKYIDGVFPENVANLTIFNNSPLLSEITFCFKNDTNSTTFMLHPVSMLIPSNERTELKVWAYPKTVGRFTDEIIGCIRDNPEPVVISISCDGVQPRLELPSKIINFEKVLIHRRETKTLIFRNVTLLPVGWKLVGVDQMRDEFSLDHEQGVVEPLSDFTLNAHYRSTKPAIIKRNLKLEVFDTERILGTIQTETLQIIGEAYDVSVDIQFNKTPDGCLDFGTIKVGDEAKHTLTIKNKGKYEVMYHLHVIPGGKQWPDLRKVFNVSPAKATLNPADRPLTVTISFHSINELLFSNDSILQCTIIEPSINGGVEIARIPIKISAKSVFSKYQISPLSDINFGPVQLHTKLQKTLTIENKGCFEFKYLITRVQKEDIHKDDKKRNLKSDTNKTKSQSKSATGKTKRSETGSRAEGPGPVQTRLVLDTFTIYPAHGTVVPGNTQQIQIEFSADQPGECLENLMIDILDRDPADNAKGIPYKLLAESFVPGINVSDYGLIFDEHMLCTNFSAWIASQSTALQSKTNDLSDAENVSTVFLLEENRFMFTNIIVGYSAAARFRISNPYKVPVDVAFVIKNQNIPGIREGAKSSRQQQVASQDAFDLQPSRANISAHSHIYVTVTFSPSIIMNYNATFETSIEGISTSLQKSRNLTFNISGEGSMPRVKVVNPTTRTAQSAPLLRYSKLAIGRNESHIVTLENIGQLPSKISLDIFDEDSAFRIILPDTIRSLETSVSQHCAVFQLSSGTQITFNVIFEPKNVGKYHAKIKVSVEDNFFEDVEILCLGDAFDDVLLIEEIHLPINFVLPQENEDVLKITSDIEALPSNFLNFGMVYFNSVMQATFTISNTSDKNFKFSAPSLSYLTFSPSIGHLHSYCRKDITVTVNYNKPINLRYEAIPFDFIELEYDQPLDEVEDWDDRKCVVKWIDIDVPAEPSVASKTSSRKKVAIEKQKVDVSNTALAVKRPTKRKVLEIDQEPKHNTAEDTRRDLDLSISLLMDYCKYRLRAESSIQFKDTLMFMTRVYEFDMENIGSMVIDYTWTVVLDKLKYKRCESSAESMNTLTPRTVQFNHPPITPRLEPMSSKIQTLPTSRAQSSCSSVKDVSLCQDEYPISEEHISEIQSPFTIEPEYGFIGPGKKQRFKLMFSPVDVSEYSAQLLCSIPNLEVGDQQPMISLKALSLLPYCHFQLEESDYLDGRRDPELRGPNEQPLDCNTRVMEFKCVGVGQTVLRTFNIRNPCKYPLKFVWNHTDGQKSQVHFRCLTANGTIAPGKEQAVSLEFQSSIIGIVESFWMFRIIAHGIDVPFLLVGDTIEPLIAFDRLYLNFKNLLVGRKFSETIYITNSEDTPFNFSFDQDTLYSAAHDVQIEALPLKGTVLPRSKFAVELYLTTIRDEEVIFHVKAKVQHKPSPLRITVKAQGYSLTSQLLIVDGDNTIELGHNSIEELNLGKVEVKDNVFRYFQIVNTCPYTLTYNWSIDNAPKGITMTPMSGFVTSDKHAQCELNFIPTKVCELNGSNLKLAIVNGPVYHIALIGQSVAPLLKLSFTQYDFGFTFVYQAGMKVKSTELEITNSDDKDISIECLSTESDYLKFKFEPILLSPGKSVKMLLKFYPRQPIRYCEALSFLVNGLTTIDVQVSGSGCKFAVEIANGKQRLRNIGTLRTGQISTRSLSIVNRSPTPASFNLICTPVTQGLLAPGVLNIAPSRVNIPAKGGVAEVQIRFAPKSRIVQFVEEVMLEMEDNYTTPLFAVTGACQGIEVSLDTSSIAFGPVMLRSQCSRKLLISNSGDMGTAFHWNPANFAPDFSMSPSNGYLSPGMSLTLRVMFHPVRENADIRYENLYCAIEGAKPLHLMLTGMCIGHPPVREVLSFTTNVRDPIKRKVNITNTSVHGIKPWLLQPVIEGEYFSGDDTISIATGETETYEITYSPLEMTKQDKPQSGSLFVPLPTGTGLLYQLVGLSGEPKPIATVVRDIPCKTAYVEVLQVPNWLTNRQRFKVVRELIKPERLEQTVKLEGLEHIQVPALGEAKYNLSFFSYRETSLQFKLFFVNESNGEYCFYVITLHATPPGVLEAFEIQCPVRKTKTQTISLENPTASTVTFNCQTPLLEVMLPSSFQIPAMTSVPLTVEFQPLRVVEQVGKLYLNCNELGLYTYQLSLQGTAPANEKATHFRCGLGSSQSQQVHFHNLFKSKTEFSCKVSQQNPNDKPEFLVDKTVTGAGSSGASGTEISLDVLYEPTMKGNTRAHLLVQSPQAGDFNFALFGTCTESPPQGPFLVKLGHTTAVPVKNIFHSTQHFTFTTQPDCFAVKGSSAEGIRAKKIHYVNISFDSTDRTATKLGTLTATCAKSTDIGGDVVTWVYYLKGVVDK